MPTSYTLKMKCRAHIYLAVWFLWSLQIQYAKVTTGDFEWREEDVVINEGRTLYPRPRYKRELVSLNVTVNYRLRNLPPNSMVRVQVRVLNKYYVGPPSPYIEFRTKEGGEYSFVWDLVFSSDKRTLPALLNQHSRLACFNMALRVFNNMKFLNKLICVFFVVIYWQVASAHTFYQIKSWSWIGIQIFCTIMFYHLPVPGPPNVFNVIARGPTYFELEWEQPREPNGVLQGYHISYQIGKISGLSHLPDR